MPSKESGNKSRSPDSGLLDFVSGVTGNDFIRIEEDLGEGFVRLSSTEAERRQARHDIRTVEDAVIELLRNSRDAGASHILIATTRDSDGVRTITVVDDGDGVPGELQEAIFQPRVTSKLDSLAIDEYGVHGRGMALFSISQNVIDCSVAFSRVNDGSSIRLRADTSKLVEKKDQSTFPTLRVRDGEKQVVRGPRNIIRALVEFSLRYPKVSIYHGSPAEITSTALSLARKGATAGRGPWRLLGNAGDASALHRAASDRLGLPISLRNAHRVFCREIEPLVPLTRRAGTVEALKVSRYDGLEEKLAEVRSGKQRLNLRLTSDDIAELRQRILEAFEPVGERYFVRPAGEPRITLGSDGLRITLPLHQED